MSGNKPYLKIEVDEEGNVTVDAINFRGRLCEEAWNEVLRELEKLGIKAKTRVSRKREYYIAVSMKQRVRYKI